ncbi:MAG: NYN domain-containing protein [Rubripirellula sp.]
MSSTDRGSVSASVATHDLGQPADRWGVQPLSLLLLIDGYNVVAPVAPPNAMLRSSNAPGFDRSRSDPMWLQRERMSLIRRLVDHLPDDVRKRTCVVFDAANPPRDRPHQFEMEGIKVRFAVGYPEADDLLEELIASHSAPKSLSVVSSDRRVQAASRRRGCAPFESQEWLDDLLDGRVQLAAKRSGATKNRAGEGDDDSHAAKPERDLDVDQVDRWLREFGF